VTGAERRSACSGSEQTRLSRDWKRLAVARQPDGWPGSSDFSKTAAPSWTHADGMTQCHLA